MTLKDKFVFTLYVATSVAVFAHATTQIYVLIAEERREAALLKKHMEEVPLSI